MKKSHIVWKARKFIAKKNTTFFYNIKKKNDYYSAKPIDNNVNN